MTDQQNYEVDLSPIVNAILISFAILNDRLETKAVLKKAEFSERLKLASKCLPRIDGISDTSYNFTCTVLGAIGEALDQQDSSPSPKQKFKLTVIDGGKSD